MRIDVLEALEVTVKEIKDWVKSKLTDATNKTETYIDEKVASLIDAAPDALNTLNELAAALGDDNNFATTVFNKIDVKVDKIDGKGLSTNDLTNDLKLNYDTSYEHSQIEHAPADAEKNVQSDWNEEDVASDSYINNKPGIASEDNLGLIKIGTGLRIDSETGIVIVTGESVVDAVEWENVLTKPTTISGYGITDAKIDVDENGVLYFG